MRARGSLPSCGEVSHCQSGFAVRTEQDVEACGVGFRTLKRNFSDAKSNWNKYTIINNVMTAVKSLLITVYYDRLAYTIFLPLFI